MNRSYLSFALLCFCALSDSVLGNPAGISITEGMGIVQSGMGLAKEGLGIINEGIDTLGKGFDLYNKFLDKFIPWDELNKTIAKLDEFRSSYSNEASELIGDIKTKMMDGMDAYFRATQSVYEWSGLAVNLLGTYKTLFNGTSNPKTFQAARAMLLHVLEDGLIKMEKGQKELGDSSSSFNNATGKLTQLNHRLAVDFDENSEYFQSQMTRIRLVGYGAAAPFLFIGIPIAAGIIEGKLIPDIKAKMAKIEKWYKDITAEVQKSFKNVDDIKAKLQQEIKNIGEVKVKTDTAKTYIEWDSTPELKEIVLTSVTDLITECKKYRARHSDIN